MPAQVNYPQTTFHIQNSANDYTEFDASNVIVKNGVNQNNAVVNSNKLSIVDIAKTATTSLTIGQLTHTSTNPLNSKFDINVSTLTFAGVSSSRVGQVIMSDASGAPYWADDINADNTTLSNVLNVSTVDISAGNANNLPITNLSKLGFNGTCELKGGTGGQLIVSTAKDTGNTRQFAQSYLPISVDGSNNKVYYIQLYEAIS